MSSLFFLVFQVCKFPPPRPKDYSLTYPEWCGRNCPGPNCEADGNSEGTKLAWLISINILGPSMIFLPPKENFGFMLYTDDSHIYIYSHDLQIHVCSSFFYTSNGKSQDISNSPPKTGFLIFTNPVLPKMSTSSSRSLRFTFHTSFLKHHINQSTNPSLHLWNKSRIWLLLIISTTAIPIQACYSNTSLSWFTVLALYFVSLLQSLSPYSLFSNTQVVWLC